VLNITLLLLLLDDPLIIFTKLLNQLLESVREFVSKIVIRTCRALLRAITIIFVINSLQIKVIIYLTLTMLVIK